MSEQVVDKVVETTVDVVEAAGRNSQLIGKAALFVGGAVLGAGVAYLITRHVYEKIIVREVNQVKDKYDLMVLRGADAPEEKRGEFTVSYETTEVTEDGSKYNSLVKEYKYGDEQTREEVTEMMHSLEPIVISDEEYNEEYEEYDKDNLVYYPSSGVIEEFASGLIVPDIELTIGADAFRLLESGEEVVYARNPRMRTDFEISRSGED